MEEDNLSQLKNKLNKVNSIYRFKWEFTGRARAYNYAVSYGFEHKRAYRISIFLRLGLAVVRITLLALLIYLKNVVFLYSFATTSVFEAQITRYFVERALMKNADIQVIDEYRKLKKEHVSDYRALMRVALFICLGVGIYLFLGVLYINSKN